jgi:hypothetical protein
MKSAKPPKTRNVARGFLRGCKVANDGAATASAILWSFPILPQLVWDYLQCKQMKQHKIDIRKFYATDVWAFFRKLYN